MHVKKGDNVIVLSGGSRGKEGKVLEVFPRKGTVIVEGINVKKKHQKQRSAQVKGQILDVAMPFPASKVKRSGEKKKVSSKKVK